MAFSDASGAERLQGRVISWTFLGVLGVIPAVGRDFTEIDSQPGRMPSVVVSHGFWQQRLGGRQDLIGLTIKLDDVESSGGGRAAGERRSVHPGPAVLRGGAMEPAAAQGAILIRAIARLRPDVSRAAAGEELRAIQQEDLPIWRASYQDEKATWAMMDLKEFVVGDVHTIAGLALAAVALVWLIACTNASNLLIARVTSRRRSRGPLGAWRLPSARRPLPAGGEQSSRAGIGGHRHRDRVGRRQPPARARDRLLPARVRDRVRRAVACRPGRAHGGERAAVRTHPIRAWSRRTGGRVAAIAGPIVDGQQGGAAPAPRAGRKPVHHRDTAPRDGRLARPQPQRAGTRGSRVRFAGTF